MRLLADENFPRVAVTALRAHGHDVLWIHEVAPGATDDAVLMRACAEQRLLLTFDKDFGELTFRYPRADMPGIILFRIPIPSAEQIAHVAVSILESRSDWLGHFAVIEEWRVRLVPLP